MSWVLAFLGFAALIILHEAGHFAAAKAVGMRVEKFSLFFGPMLVKWTRGETTYGIGPIPLGGYVKISGMSPHEELPPEVAHRAYIRQPVWKRIVVIAAGPIVNVILAFLILWVLLMLHTPVDRQRVEEVTKGSPAAQVLQPNDRLLAVDGRRGDSLDLREFLGEHRCAGGAKVKGCRAAEPAQLTILRAGRERTVAVTPRYDAEAERMLIGFRFGVDYRHEDPVAAAGGSVDRMWFVTEETVKAIVMIFYDSKAREEVSGVVGSYEATRQSFELDTYQAMFILALISLSLAVINLFPFLPLDGGHIFWALAEKVRGRPIPFSVLERVSAVGFMLVLILFVIGLTNDIGRLRGEGFGIR